MINILHVVDKNSKFSGDALKFAWQKGPGLSVIFRRWPNRLDSWGKCSTDELFTSILQSTASGCFTVDLTIRIFFAIANLPMWFGDIRYWQLRGIFSAIPDIIISFIGKTE